MSWRPFGFRLPHMRKARRRPSAPGPPIPPASNSLSIRTGLAPSSIWVKQLYRALAVGPHQAPAAYSTFRIQCRFSLVMTISMSSGWISIRSRFRGMSSIASNRRRFAGVSISLCQLPAKNPYHAGDVVTSRLPDPDTTLLPFQEISKLAVSVVGP